MDVDKTKESTIVTRHRKVSYRYTGTLTYTSPLHLGYPMRVPLYWTRALSVSTDKGHPQILLIVKIHDILYIDGRLLFELIK